MALTAGLSGCLGDSVNLTNVEIRHPRPRVVTTDDEDIPNGTHRFTATVENIGIPGNADINLTLFENPDRTGDRERVGTDEQFFAADERRDVTLRASLAEYRSFAFVVLVAEAEVEVRNDGDSGEVSVQIQQQGGRSDGRVFAEKTVELGGETTETVFFPSLDILDSVDNAVQFSRTDAQLATQVETVE